MTTGGITFTMIIRHAFAQSDVVEFAPAKEVRRILLQPERSKQYWHTVTALQWCWTRCRSDAPCVRCNYQLVCFLELLGILPVLILVIEKESLLEAGRSRVWSICKLHCGRSVDWVLHSQF